jgi:hypothetical protein
MVWSRYQHPRIVSVRCRTLITELRRAGWKTEAASPRLIPEQRRYAAVGKKADASTNDHPPFKLPHTGGMKRINDYCGSAEIAREKS